MTEDNPDNTAALQAAIKHCWEVNASRLVVPKGVYRFTSDQTVLFEGLKDFVFDGNGSKFVFYKKYNNLFQISNCERVEFKDFKVDWDWDVDPLGSVVKVENVNPLDGSVDLLFVDYDKFSRDVIRIRKMEGLDKATMSVGCEGCVDIFFEFVYGTDPHDRTHWLSGNQLRLFATEHDQIEKFKNNLTAGMLFRIRHYGYDMHGLVLTDNVHLTLRDIDIYSCPGHALLSSGEQHHWQFIQVNIIRPPDSKRPITCTADHHHIARSQGFFLMENCEFSLGGDDCLNVHDTTAFAYYQGKYTVRSKKVADAVTYQKGDRIELRNDDYSPTGLIGTLKNPVTEIDKNTYEFTFEEPIPKPTGSGFVLFNLRFNSRNIIVRNCHFHSNSARGLLLLGRDITIENNRFFHTQMSAIKIEAGWTHDLWSEGYGASNIVIANNVFDTINPMRAYPIEMRPVIYISTYLGTDPSEDKTSYPILKSILVEANEFRNSPGAIIYVSSAAHVTIRKNTILNDSPLEKYRYRGVIGAAYCSDLSVTENRWTKSNQVPNPGIWVEGDTTRDLHCSDNRVVIDKSKVILWVCVSICSFLIVRMLWNTGVAGAMTRLTLLWRRLAAAMTWLPRPANAAPNHRRAD